MTELSLDQLTDLELIQLLDKQDVEYVFGMDDDLYADMLESSTYTEYQFDPPENRKLVISILTRALNL